VTETSGVHPKRHRLHLSVRSGGGSFMGGRASSWSLNRSVRCGSMQMTSTWIAAATGQAWGVGDQRAGCE